MVLRKRLPFVKSNRLSWQILKGFNNASTLLFRSTKVTTAGFVILPNHGIGFPIAQPASGFDDFRSLANVDATDNLPSGGFTVDSFLVGSAFSTELSLQRTAIFGCLGRCVGR